MSYPVYMVPAGDVLPVFFSSYGKTNGESITLSGLAVTDIEIYKDGGVTQRASDAGYTLLDTDGIDFDTITGIHGFSIDTGDNTDAGFYTVGAWFHVVVSAVTVDTQTVNFIACAFRLLPAEGVAGKPKVDVDAFGGSAGTFSGGRPEVNTTHAAGTAWGSGAITAASIAADAITAAKIADGAIDAATFAAGAINAAAIADGAIDRATFAADTGLQTVRSNTAQAGAAGSVTLDASASATNNFYVGCPIILTGGTGVGQTRICTAYDGTTKVATTSPNWATNPDNTSTFAVLPANLAALNSSLQVVAASVAGAVGSVTGNVGGNVTGSIGSVAAGGIAANSFAAGAIDAAAIAADAIGSSELAATAASEVATAVAALTLTEPTGVPAVNATWAAALAWLLVLSRNLVTQTSTTQTLKADDGLTTIATSTHSDDGTTHSRGEWA